MHCKSIVSSPSSLNTKSLQLDTYLMLPLYCNTLSACAKV
nr:MAG TPA: hypothetical protein [Caudoviricetes sp.]